MDNIYLLATAVSSQRLEPLTDTNGKYKLYNGLHLANKCLDELYKNTGYKAIILQCFVGEQRMKIVGSDIWYM